MAFPAASMARLSPEAQPMPMMASPMPCMTVFTSGEIDIDLAGDGDEVGDALNALAKDVVREEEGLLDGRPASRRS